jgi:hypothetical protein
MAHTSNRSSDQLAWVFIVLLMALLAGGLYWIGR